MQLAMQRLPIEGQTDTDLLLLDGSMHDKMILETQLSCVAGYKLCS